MPWDRFLDSEGNNAPDVAENICRGRQAIALAKRRGMNTAEWEQRLKELFNEAGKEPGPEAGLEPWMLWE